LADLVEHAPADRGGEADQAIVSDSERRNWFGSRFQIWFGLALGLGTFYLAARSIDFHSLAETLRAVRLPFVALTLVTSLLTIVLKAVRWRWLLYPDRKPGPHVATPTGERGPTGQEALAAGQFSGPRIASINSPA
jgi:hypothetical protein